MLITHLALHPFTAHKSHVVMNTISISLYCTHAEASSTDCTTVTAASVTGTFIIAFILGAATGAIALRLTMSKQSYSPKPKEDQNPPPGPVYDTVFDAESVPTRKDAIELQENFAYGPIEQN